MKEKNKTKVQLINELIELRQRVAELEILETERKRTEEALKQKEKQLESFFSQSLDGCFFMMLDEPVQWNDTVDKDEVLDYVFTHQRITKVNDAMLAQYGATREQFLGLTPAAAFAHDIAHGKAVWCEFFDQGRLGIETNERKFDGTPMWIEGEYVCLYDEQGRITGHFGIQREATKRKQMEEALRESEEKFRQLAETVQDAFWIGTPEIGNQRCVLYVNPAFEKIFGIKREDICKSDTVWLETVHEEDRERILSTLEKFLQDQGDYDVEYQIVRSDGSVHWIWAKGFSMKNEKGEIYRTCGLAQDITERKRAQEALKESEVKYRLISENIPVAVYSALPDEHSTNVFVSGRIEELTGYSGKQFLENPELWPKIVHPEDRGYVWEKIEEHRQNRILLDVEYRIITANNVIKWIRDKATPVLDENNQIIRINGFMEDITEHKQAEEYQKMALQILELLNQSDERLNIIREILLVIKGFTGVEAVGIRLREGEDFPYYETNGFPPEFVEAERSLCAHDQAGKMIRDWKGNPSLECMCGNVICGRTTPELPFFTEGGSFWTNSTTDLLASTTEKDRQARTRNRCHGEGYESVALIPLRSDGEPIGLLQLNDHRANMFTLALIHFFEGIGASIGIALKRGQTEEALRESENLMRQVIDTTPVCIFVIDQKSKFLLTNKYMAAFRRTTPEEMVGKTDFDYALRSIANAEEVEKFLSDNQEVIASKRPKFIPEEKFTLLDGSTKYFQTTKIPLTLRGNLNCLLGVAVDITDHKRAEEELRKHREHLEELVKERTAKLQQEIAERKRAEAEIAASARRLQSIIETVGDGITLSDKRGYFEIFNSRMEEITGYTREEVNSCDYFLRCMYPDPQDYQQAATGIQEIVQKGGSRDIETTIRAKDGTPKTLLVSTSIVQYQNDDWFLSVYHDITAHKRTEKALRQAKEVADAANRAKSDFLTNMSHELRTPLNAILGYAQILKEANNLSERQREGLETIKSSGEHLLNLINEILDLAKIEAEYMELQMREFHLSAFLENIANIIRIHAEQKGIAFMYESDLSLSVGVHADEKRLQEVLLNLLENAVKFTETGRVTFRVKKLDTGYSILDTGNQQLAPSTQHPASSIQHPASSIQFQVEDTGIGIAPEKLDEIFLPFQRVGEHRSSVEGTGLGLTISRKLVEMMGGELHVNSTVGEGSIFWFDLSLPEVSGFVPQVEPRERKIIDYAGERRTVLVADDEPANRAILVDRLLALGFNVIEAENGQECLEKARKFRPDVILLDLLMPVMDGIETACQIREAKELREIILIAVSAGVYEDTQRSSLDAGCDDFLSKPVDFKALLDLLHTYLHLEWIYKEDVEEPPKVVSHPPSDVQSISLPLEDLEILLDLAIKSRIKLLLEYLARLETLDENYRPFIEELRQLAKRYQSKEIVKCLQQIKRDFRQDKQD